MMLSSPKPITDTDLWRWPGDANRNQPFKAVVPDGEVFGAVGPGEPSDETRRSTRARQKGLLKNASFVTRQHCDVPPIAHLSK